MQRRAKDALWRFALRNEALVRRVHPRIVTALGLWATLLRLMPGTSWRFGAPRKATLNTHEWATSCELPVREVDAPTVLHRNPVSAGDQKIPAMFTAPTEWTAPSTYVVELPDARAWGDAAVPVAADDTLLADFELFALQKVDDLPIAHRPWLGTPRHIEGTTATLVGLYSQSYYHWLLDLLPRYDILMRSGFPFDRVLVPPGAKFHHETLERAGIPEERRVVHAPGDYHRFERLLVPSMPRESGPGSPLVVNYVRRLFAPELEVSERKRRLYVGRADVNRRAVTNEAELVACLEPLGFESVVMAGMSVAEQARLFASAEVVVAPHGGALTNLVFAHPGTKVLELFGPGYAPACYWSMAQTLGLEHRPLFQEVDGVTNGVRWANYHVAPERLLAALADLGVLGDD